MTHIHIRKKIGVPTEYAGRTWFYNFRSIPEFCQESTVTETCQRLLQGIAPIAKGWNNATNSEWISRIYFAGKMILGASVMAQSLEFATAKNLRTVISYLDYYTVLNTLRAILLTNPYVAWDNGMILQTTHTKTINVVDKIISQFDKTIAEQAKKHITHLKAFRELISYRAPSSGDAFPRPDVDIIGMCRLFAEIAQMQSELIEASVQKNAIGSFSLSTEAIEGICKNEIDGFSFYDEEDHNRMGYLQRKYPLPTNIVHMMSEGHVEDFFGSWCASEEAEDKFNPDDNWRILFDVP
ncbi:MAG: hypothetical protein MUO31_15420 [Thermodesulfovibrionales bacterium]|nr:hypothetical protein [Thermodesulfovibrionales bacterium]